MKVLTRLLISTSFVGGLAFSNFAFAMSAIEHGLISAPTGGIQVVTPANVAPADVRIAPRETMAPKAMPAEKRGMDEGYSKGGAAVGEKGVSKGSYEKGFSGEK